MLSQLFLLHAAGVVLIIIAGANVFIPAKLGYAENLARVSPIVRQVFTIHALYILLVVVGSGALCLFLAPRLSAADPLSAAVSGFLAFFWSLRLVIQLFYMDGKFVRQHLLAHFAYLLACGFLGFVFLETFWQSLGMARL